MRQQSRREPCSRKAGLEKLEMARPWARAESPWYRSARFFHYLLLTFPSSQLYSDSVLRHKSFPFPSFAWLFFILSGEIDHRSLTCPVPCRLVESRWAQVFDSSALVFRRCARRVFRQIGTEMCQKLPWSVCEQWFSQKVLQEVWVQQPWRFGTYDSKNAELVGLIFSELRLLTLLQKQIQWQPLTPFCSLTN